MLSPDWLFLKVLIGTQGYHLIPIKFAFALLTTTHPTSPMAFHNAHGAGCNHFTCSTPWQHKKVSQFDNTRYTMSAINVHQPYPTAYQVGVIAVYFRTYFLPFLSNFKKPSFFHFTRSRHTNNKTRHKTSSYWYKRQQA